jgi:hypothetical protein
MELAISIGFPPGTSPLLVGGTNEIWFYPPGTGPQDVWPSVIVLELSPDYPWPDASEIEKCSEALFLGQPVIFRFETSRDADTCFNRLLRLSALSPLQRGDLH